MLPLRRVLHCINTLLSVLSARCFCDLNSLKTYFIRSTYSISILLAAGGYEKIILLLNYNQYKKKLYVL